MSSPQAPAARDAQAPPEGGAQAPTEGGAQAPTARGHRVLRGAALLMLAVAATLALGAELRHRAAAHADFALLQVQSKPLGPSQMARLLTWLSSHPLGAQARFEVAPRGLFSRTQIVTVSVPGFEPAQFEVHGDGQVRPADAGGERLAAAVVAWSTDPATLAQLEAEAAAAQAAVEEAAESGRRAQPPDGALGVPPVRPYLPD